MSLEALQRAALGQGQGKVVDWLEVARPRRQSAPRAPAHRWMPGWERAVETVLGTYLEAVCVDSHRRRGRHAREPLGGHGDVLCRRAGAGRQRPRRRQPARARAGARRARRAVRGHRRHRHAGRGARGAAATARRPVGDHPRRHLDRPGLAAREPRPGRARGRHRARAGAAAPAGRARGAAGAQPRARRGTRSRARAGCARPRTSSPTSRPSCRAAVRRT